MLSLAHIEHYYQLFLCQGLGMGIGAGCLYAPALAIQAHHWYERRALAMGIVVTGSSVGGIIFPIMLNQLINVNNIGFGWGVRASAFLVLGLLAAANLLLRENPAAVKKNRPKPDLKGILTDVPFMMVVFSYVLLMTLESLCSERLIRRLFVCLWGLFFPSKCGRAYIYKFAYLVFSGDSFLPSTLLYSARSGP
jgi:MFS family permease